MESQGSRSPGGVTNDAIYIVTQDSPYTGLLLGSAASLKRVMPDLPITVLSQFPVESPLLERVNRVEGSTDGFYDKTRAPAADSARAPGAGFGLAPGLDS